MADEALMELLVWLKEGPAYDSDAPGRRSKHKEYADALESALSELARLRAFRDTITMFHSQPAAPAQTARDHPTDEEKQG